MYSKIHSGSFTVRCLIPGTAQGPRGWGPEQPAPMEGIPDHSRGVGTR